MLEVANKNMIKTSVIIPVYNTSQYLEECINSIFAQTQSEIEVIAIDDGSTDQSLSILRQLELIYPKLQIISQKNHGQGFARNIGIEVAKGEYIYFVDSDDYIKENTLEKCYIHAKENNLDVLMFDADIFGPLSFAYNKNIYDRSNILSNMGVISGTHFILHYFEKCYCPSPCLIYTSSKFLKENRIRFLPNLYYEDNEFYCHIILKAQKIMYIPSRFYMRRYRENSTMTSVFDEKKAFSLLGIAAGIGKLAKDNKEIERIYKKQATYFLEDAVQRSIINNLVTNRPDLAKNILDTAIYICGEADEKEGYFYTNLLYTICFQLPSSFMPPNLLETIKKKRKRELEKMIKDIPLDKEDKLVGIYGMGKYMDKFLRAYEECRKIQANLIFIDSYTKTLTQKCRGADVYHVDDIGGLRLDCILICSSLYEADIYNTLLNKYGERFSVICVKRDLNFI